MSKVQVDTIDTRSGTSTMQIGSTNTSTINIGVSGDTVNIPSGVTIANAGTATGFGGANTPAFHVYLSANQTVSNATETKVQFNTELYDTGNAYDNSSNYRYTPQTSGKYYFYTDILLDSASNNNNIDYVYTEIRKNGTSVTNTIFDFRTDRDGRKFSVNNFTTVDMNGSSDYVEVFGTISASYTGDLKIGGGVATSYFGGYKLII